MMDVDVIKNPIWMRHVDFDNIGKKVPFDLNLGPFLHPLPR
jgi:hypothetical protein